MANGPTNGTENIWIQDTFTSIKGIAARIGSRSFILCGMEKKSSIKPTNAINKTIIIDASITFAICSLVKESKNNDRPSEEKMINANKNEMTRDKTIAIPPKPGTNGFPILCTSFPPIFLFLEYEIIYGTETAVMMKEIINNANSRRNIISPLLILILLLV